MLTNVFTGRPARGIKNRVVRDLGPIESYLSIEEIIRQLSCD